MNPFIELMQAAALIMLLFAAVLISVVIRHTSGAKTRVRLGPVVIGVALILFAAPIYASVIGTDDLDRFTTGARMAAAIMLPVGLYLLGTSSAAPAIEVESPDEDA